MGLRKISLAVFLVGVMGLVSLAYTGCAQESQDDYLKPHNEARAEVGVDPLIWNDTVAASAESYAIQRIGDCSMQNSHGPYGENLAASSGSLTGTEAVSLWVAEKRNYDYSSNSCVQGSKVCEVYTQVVWRGSTHLGCARVQCSNGGWFVVCNYDPKGNIVGQRPY